MLVLTLWPNNSTVVASGWWVLSDFPPWFLIGLKFLIELYLANNIILISGVQHSDSTFTIFYHVITTISLVTICYCAKLLQYYYYISYTAYHIPWLIYFITGNLYFLFPFTYFACPSTSLPSGNHYFVLCIFESVPVLFCLFVPYFLIGFKIYILYTFSKQGRWL